MHESTVCSGAARGLMPAPLVIDMGTGRARWGSGLCPSLSSSARQAGTPAAPAGDSR
jgi:hypothetical protein